jgi:hypothetical protein
MAKRKAVVSDQLGDDILDRLRDLHKQATVERSHYYVCRCVSDAINEITALRKRLGIPHELKRAPIAASSKDEHRGQ